MADNSSQPPIFAVIFMCVPLITYIGDDDNDVFDDKNTRSSIFFRSIFIINETNGGRHKNLNLMLMIAGKKITATHICFRHISLILKTSILEPP